MISSNIPSTVKGTTSTVTAAGPKVDAVGKPSSSSNSKPRRPLSGYNLFYRYKRNKVLEATARLRGHNGAASPDEEKRAIDETLQARPGLEGVPPGHVVWAFPPRVVDELRRGNIRHAMYGKLSPNENARSRLHRKVHGMGFVEMGRVMREMWAGIDKFTKTVFDELADVGRARYRMLSAAYKLKGKIPWEFMGMDEEAQQTEREQATDPSTSSAAVPLSALSSEYSPAVAPTLIEAMPDAMSVQQAAILAGMAPLCPLPGTRRCSVSSQASALGLPRSRRGSDASQASILGSIPPILFPSYTNPLAVPSRRVSTNSLDGFLDNFDDILGSSRQGRIPLEARHDVNKTFEQYLKRHTVIPRPSLINPPSSADNLSSNNTSSTNMYNTCPSNMSSNNTSSDNMSSSNTSCSHNRSRNSITSDTSSSNNSSNDMSSNNTSSTNMLLTMTQGENSYLEIISSGCKISNNLADIPQGTPLTDLEKAVVSNVISDTENVDSKPLARPDDVSTQDFLELLGTLDDALETHGLDDGAHITSEKADDCPSTIFGMPIHEVRTVGAIVPDTRAPNNFRARMA